MDPLTLVILGVIGFVFITHQQGPSGPMVPANGTGPGIGPQPAGNTGGAAGGLAGACGGGVVGKFIADHEQRKASIGALVGEKYGVPAALANPLSKFASKLDVSGYVENFAAGKLCKYGPQLARAGLEALKNPVSTGLGIGQKVNNLGIRGTGLIDRGVSQAYGALPTPLKIAAAPLVIPEKITATAVKKVGAVANKVTGALSSGAKTAEHAISNGVNKVLGWL